MPPRDDRPRRRDDARGAPPRAPARPAAGAPPRPSDGAAKRPAKAGSRAPRPLSERKAGDAPRKRRAEAPAAGGPMRLQRALARAGIASRRAADALVAEGRVTVNGAPGEVGQVVNPARDEILVDGQRIAAVAPLEWVVLHKPAGVLTTRADPEGRPTVFDLVPNRPGLTYVGRLDYMTEGVLLFTTDGDAAHRLTHPSRAVERTYVAVVRGNAPAAVRTLRRGLVLEDGVVEATDVDARPIGNRRWEFELTIAEGRTREVRRVCEALDLAVERLVRVRFGPVRLGALPSGETRALNGSERRVIDALTQAEVSAAGEVAEVLRAVGRDGRRGEAPPRPQAPRPRAAPAGRVAGAGARDDGGRTPGVRTARGTPARAGSDDRSPPADRGPRRPEPRQSAPRGAGAGGAGRGSSGRDRGPAADGPTRGDARRGPPARGRPTDDGPPRGRPGPGREPRPAGRVPGGGRGR